MDDVNFEHIERLGITLQYSHCQKNNFRKLINITHFAYAASHNRLVSQIAFTAG